MPSERGSRKNFRKNILAIGIGLALSSVLVFGTEGTFYLLNHRPSRSGGEDPYLFQFSDLLGYKPLPNADKRAWRIYDGETAFDVRYRTDEHGRRITPGPDAADRFLIFFGCSFVFGEAVAENETLPAQAAGLLSGVRAYNYGYSGYGPQQMLAKLESRTLDAEVGEPVGDVVYVFISHHVRRAIGSMRMWKQWGRHFPYYVLENGAPVRHGSFLTGRPKLSRVYDLLAREQILRYFDVDFPLTVSDEDIDLTAAMIVASAKLFEEQFPVGKFLVVIYPESKIDDHVPERVASKLVDAGIAVMDLGGLFDLADADYHVARDGHPSAAANALAAEELALKLLESRPET